MEEKKLSFLVSESYQAMGLGGIKSGEFTKEEISVQSLREQFQEMSDSLGAVFSDIQMKCSKYELDEIELKVDISAKTGISIIAKAEMEVGGGITLKFKRKEEK